METPRGHRSGGKLRSRLKSSATSTPKSTRPVGGDGSKNDPAPESPIPYPCSQSTYNPTGVYWNYEASPAAKARLQALLNRSSDEDDEPVRPPTPPENHTPAIKLRLRPTLYREADDEATRSPPPKFDPDKQMEILEDLRALRDNIEAKKRGIQPTTTVSTPPPLPKPSATPSIHHPSSTHNSRRSSSGDLFADDSADNSFLIQCTQAAEKAHFRPPSRAEEPVAPSRGEVLKTKVAETSDKPQGTESSAKVSPGGFDDDDEFDMLLSQMPDSELKAATPKAKAAATALGGGAAWRRVHSSPEATTTSGALTANCKMKLRHQTESSVTSGGFNKELAEKRKREAIQRRESRRAAAAAAAAAAPPTQLSATTSTSVKSSTAKSASSVAPSAPVIQPPPPHPVGKPKVWSKEDNERKRQEALKKRQLSQARKDTTKRK